MRIPQPFIPVRAESENLSHTVHVIGRDYTFGPDGMLTSIQSQGQEFLAAPIRIVAREDGNPSVWDRNYPENESESFIQERSDENVIICGAMQSERFIVDTCSTVCYDGNVDIDFKVMTRGKTVAQVFGIADVEPTHFKLDQLWLEIPLRADAFPLFHMYPNSEIKLANGERRPLETMSMSGNVPEPYAGMPFKPLLWLGNEERGLGWFADNDRNWQPADEESAMELIRENETLILRIRLLDSHPEMWVGDDTNGSEIFYPIDFHFGFQATPVKPFPKQPYLHNALHIDCGIKIKGNYKDFFEAENRFDKLVEKGVTTLILHEKWNKTQNWFALSEYSREQLCYICEECHKRGIKVLPYFGYEISTMSSEWSKLKSHVTVDRKNENLDGGWWRVPFQRDYKVCYQTEYESIFLNGVARIMDECHVDGVYLDTIANPMLCYSIEHGCGWYDTKGIQHGGYQVRAIRNLFQKLYQIVSSRGGHINVHSFGCVNFTALPYINQSWYGENLQFVLMKGNTEDINLDYFRSEYLGRNMGVPVEFIAYENRPYWRFESALSCAVLHGILPRPNDINYPLELMSRVWKIFGKFPIEQSEWKPYWNNEAETSHEKVKVSYYAYTALDGKKTLLAFVVNISAQPIEKVTVKFKDSMSTVLDLMEQQEIGFSFDLDSYGSRILYVK